MNILEGLKRLAILAAFAILAIAAVDGWNRGAPTTNCLPPAMYANSQRPGVLPPDVAAAIARCPTTAEALARRAKYVGMNVLYAGGIIAVLWAAFGWVISGFVRKKPA